MLYVVEVEIWLRDSTYHSVLLDFERPTEQSLRWTVFQSGSPFAFKITTEYSWPKNFVISLKSSITVILFTI